MVYYYNKIKTNRQGYILRPDVYEPLNIVQANTNQTCERLTLFTSPESEDHDGLLRSRAHFVSVEDQSTGTEIGTMKRSTLAKTSALISALLY